MNIDIIVRKNVVKCANQKSAGGNVKGQEREKKGRFVYTRRVQKENVRRMLIASVCFFILFFVNSLVLQIQTAGAIKPYIMAPFMVLAELYAGVYILRSYRWLSRRKKWDMRLQLYLFWLIFVTLMLAASFMSERTFFKLSVYWIMTAVLASVPLWNNKEFLVSQGIQIAALLFLIVYQKLGVETVIYLSANQLMCCVISRQGYYNFLQRAADATAIDTAKTLSETDPMTNLLNRRGLERSLERVWTGCVRNNRKVAVIMIDIDNFKKYNDHFGHLEGDTCIRRVTAEIHKMTGRKSDLAARVGGEEFVVCLPGMEKGEALNWAIKLKENVESLNIPQAEENFLPFVSVSVGVVCGYARRSADFEQMRKKADEALYEAKESGRACVYMDGECHARTRVAGNIRQYYMERGFRSLG